MSHPRDEDSTPDDGDSAPLTAEENDRPDFDSFYDFDENEEREQISAEAELDEDYGNSPDYMDEEEFARQSRRDMRNRQRARRRWFITGGVILVIVVVGLVVVPWMISLLGDDEPEDSVVSRDPSPGLDGIIAREMPPEQFEPGECLTDFDSPDDPASVIECDQDHSAQLIGRKTFADDEAYPGKESVDSASEEFCSAIELSGTSEASVVIEISQPSEGSWEEEDDRRVDCYAKADEGVLSSSLVTNPAVDNANEDEADEDGEDSESNSDGEG